MPTLLTTLIKIYPPTLPAGYCYPSTSPQTLANDFFNGAVAEFRSDIGNIAYNMGDTVPSAENRPFPWLRTVGGLIDGWWQFAAGAWISPFNWGYGDVNDRLLWEGDPADVPTKDGGEAGVISATTGPFWEIDTNYDGRSPMGPGEITGAVPAKTLVTREAYGSGAHLQLETEVAHHAHALAAGASIQDGDGVNVVNTGGGSVTGLFIGESGNANTDLTVAQSDSAGVDQVASPIVHPVRGCYLLKRTGRTHRRIDV